MLLSVLDAGPAHGYEVSAELRRRSDGDFDLPEGTIYPALHRLEKAGLLSSTWDDSGTRRRRIYQLTAQGASALVEEKHGWQRFAASVNLVLGVA